MTDAKHTPGPWRPIETAPKDGTGILIRQDNGTIHFAWWEECHGDWARPDSFIPKQKRLSHWMPLPAAPTSEGG